MTSKISNLKEEDGKTIFTISNIDVSYVNAIRRTILSDIPIVVFKTTPYEENKANIITNTSRLNNEIVKQRLSCIPICIKNLEEFLIATKKASFPTNSSSLNGPLMESTWSLKTHATDVLSGKFKSNTSRARQ